MIEKYTRLSAVKCSSDEAVPILAASDDPSRSEEDTDLRRLAALQKRLSQDVEVFEGVGQDASRDMTRFIRNRHSLRQSTLEHSSKMYLKDLQLPLGND